MVFMKALFLMFSRIKQYFLKNKLIFVLFILGGMLNTVMLIYCYGNLLSVVLDRNSQKEAYITYYYFYDDGKVTEDSLREFMKTDLLREVYVRRKIPSGIVPGSTPSIIIPYHPDNVFTLYDGTMEFTAPNQVLAPKGSEYQVGDRIFLFNTGLEVIGIVDSPNINYNYVVPLDTFLDMGLHNSIESIFAYSKERQDFLTGRDAVEDLFNRILPDYKSTVHPSMFISAILRETVVALPGILITYIIAVLSYIFLLRYLVDATIDESIISMIVGAQKSTMVVSIFWETTILTLGAGVLGVLVHVLLYQPFFAHINIHEYVTYRATDYWYILLVVFIVGLLVVFPVVMKYIKLSPIAARRAKS